MRRAGVLLAALLVALAGTVALIAVLQSRDDANLDAPAGGGPGVVAPQEDEERLRRGNVVLTYRDPGDRDALRRLAEEIAGPPDPELEELGQAIVVEREAGQAAAVVAHAYRRRLETGRAGDPQLRRFAEAFLGAASVE